jgi:hypothetical protein
MVFKVEVTFVYDSRKIRKKRETTAQNNIP